MAYLDTKTRPDPASMVGVAAIHCALGAALYFGLTVTGIIAPEKPNLTVLPYREPPPPPPMPEPTVAPTAAPSASPYMPPLPLPFPSQGPVIDQTDVFPRPQPTVQPGTGDVVERPMPTPTASFTPLPATPRTDPKRWVTTDDYRSNWIRQEMTGKARFRLEIAADGRVTNCIITGSSGHSQLDAATCALVSKRAKFQPARGNGGEPVAGTYSNAIDWQLPE